MKQPKQYQLDLKIAPIAFSYASDRPAQKPELDVVTCEGPFKGKPVPRRRRTSRVSGRKRPDGRRHIVRTKG